MFCNEDSTSCFLISKYTFSSVYTCRCSVYAEPVCICRYPYTRLRSPMYTQCPCATKAPLPCTLHNVTVLSGSSSKMYFINIPYITCFDFSNRFIFTNLFL